MSCSLLNPKDGQKTFLKNYLIILLGTMTMTNDPKKNTRKALKEKSTSYNARFVLRYNKLFNELTTEDDEQQ
jgi:hypothetical protein